MNFYDREINIIETIQSMKLGDVRYANKTKAVKDFFMSLYRGELFKNWKDNSGKDQNPPDFYSDKYKYMLEVMRVDDYAFGPNSPNALESKLYKKYNDERRKNGLPTFEEENAIVLLLPDMSHASKNNYDTYVKNFTNIVGKHILKVNTYRDNHPDYKLGFLIFDEAAGYVVYRNRLDKIPLDRPILVDSLHWHFKDKRMIDVFLNSDVDYVIWVTPNKNLPMNPKLTPGICIFDLSRSEKGRIKMINYKVDEMVCLEQPQTNV